MPKIKPEIFKSKHAEELYNFWVSDPYADEILDSIWQDLWVKVDEAYYLWGQYKSSALVPALEALEMAPGSPITRVLVADVYFRNQDYTNAEPYAEYCTTLYTEDTYWFIKYAKCLAHFKDEKAVEYFDKAIELATASNVPDTIAFSLAEKARFLMNQERFDEALALTKQAIEISPTSSIGYGILGQIYLKNKTLDLSEGLAVLEQGLKIIPNNPSILSLRGNLLAELERYEEAVASYDACIKYTYAAGEEYAISYDYSCIADCLFKLGRMSEAIGYLDRAQETMDREGYSLPERMASTMDSAFALKASVMREIESFEEAACSDGDEDLDAAELVEEARTTLTSTAATATSTDLEFLLSDFKSMRQELAELRAEKEALASDAEGLKAYVSSKHAEKEAMKEMVAWIKSVPPMKEYYTAVISTLDEILISAKAVKGGYVEAREGFGIPGSTLASALPFGGIVSAVNAAVSAIQTQRLENEASRVLSTSGFETVSGAEKLFKKIAIESCRHKYEIIQSVEINEDSASFTLLAMFSELKAKFVEARHISAASKYGVQDAMQLSILFKSGELKSLAEETVLTTCVNKIVDRSIQLSYIDTIRQGFALKMRPAEEVSAFFESKALYGGSPVAAPSYMDTAPKGGSGGTEKKSGGGLFGIKKLFGGKKLKFMDDDFVTEWDPGEGGIFSLSGNTDVLDAEEFC